MTDDRLLINTLHKIGRQLGYGHAMAILSALWRRELIENGIPGEAAFVETIMDFIKPEERLNIRASMQIYDALISGVVRTENQQRERDRDETDD